MSEVSRRDLLRTIAVSAAAGISAAEGQHVHQAVGNEKKAAGGVYKPRAFTAHEYATITRLCGLIFPGAVEGGAPEFIDLLASNNQDLQTIYTGGVAWLDHEMAKRYQASFTGAQADRQTAMLDLIAYRKNETPELAPGIRFFDWIRKMTADAYYTSKPGIADLGFMGNKGMAKFQVPVEAIDYALKRSGL